VGSGGGRTTDKTGKLLGTLRSTNLPVMKYLSEKYKSDT